MRKIYTHVPILLALMIVPALAFAQLTYQMSPTPTCGDGLGGMICRIHSLLNNAIPLIITIGVVYFVWGVVRYVIADGEEAKKQGKDRIIFGIIGFAVIFSLWGLVKVLVKTFNLDGMSLVPIQNPLEEACVLDANAKFQDVLCYLTNIINDSIIPLLFAVAGAFFVWGTVKFFFLSAGEEAKRQQGREFMIWGVIALTVMLCVWGLVEILGTTFGIDATVLPQVKP